MRLFVLLALGAALVVAASPLVAVADQTTATQGDPATPPKQVTVPQHDIYTVPNSGVTVQGGLVPGAQPNSPPSGAVGGIKIEHDIGGK